MPISTQDPKVPGSPGTVPTLEIWDETVHLKTGQYRDGSTALQLETAQGEPFATISVWLPESRDLPRDVVYVKGYSENAPIVPLMTQAGWITEAPEYPPVANEWVTIQAYRVPSLTAERTREQAVETTRAPSAPQRARTAGRQIELD